MSKVFIYHHNDLDGITAGAIVYNMYKKVYDEIVTIPINTYAQVLDMSSIEKDDIVYFVDYSFTNTTNIKNLHNLVNRIGYDNIYWIDHHNSSLKLLRSNEWMKNINGIIYDGICGAVLTFYFSLTSNTQSDESFAKDVIVRLLKKQGINSISYDSSIPLFLRYVNSWDVFLLDMKNTVEFKYGAEYIFNDPKNEDFVKVLDKNNIAEYDTIVDDCIKRGTVIGNYLGFINESQIKENSFETTLEGYTILAVNMKGSSTMFGTLFDNYDMVCPFYYCGKENKWVYSLYTSKDNINTLKISEKYGGGGHPKASGFQTDKLIFKD